MSLAAAPVISPDSTATTSAAKSRACELCPVEGPVAQFAGQFVDDPPGHDVRWGAAADCVLEEVTRRSVGCQEIYFALP